MDDEEQGTCLEIYCGKIIRRVCAGPSLRVEGQDGMVLFGTHHFEACQYMYGFRSAGAVRTKDVRFLK